MGPIILGISPGTRLLGIAVFRNRELVEWQVKSFKQHWSVSKLEAILRVIEQYVEHYQVKTIAMKITSPAHASPGLQLLTKKIVQRARQQGIIIFPFTLHDIKCMLQRNQKQSRYALMEFLAEKYPILRKAYLKEMNNENPYYLPMFEAIAVARLVHSEREETKYLNV